MKKEQVQPIFRTITVSSDADTDVSFIDADDPDKVFQIGYLTPGMKEKIRLKKDHWYIVHGGGNLTLEMVNVRIP